MVFLLVSVQFRFSFTLTSGASHFSYITHSSIIISTRGAIATAMHIVIIILVWDLVVILKKQNQSVSAMLRYFPVLQVKI